MRSDVNAQSRANPRRCQPITVSGFTIVSVSAHLDQTRESTTQKARSTGATCGRFLSRRRTASCCRSARFSATRPDVPQRRSPSPCRSREIGTRRAVGSSHAPDPASPRAERVPPNRIDQRFAVRLDDELTQTSSRRAHHCHVHVCACTSIPIYRTIGDLPGGCSLACEVDHQWRPLSERGSFPAIRSGTIELGRGPSRPLRLRRRSQIRNKRGRRSHARPTSSTAAPRPTGAPRMCGRHMQSLGNAARAMDRAAG
jgi:hypothetical protein